jgi:hypothetical protein
MSIDIGLKRVRRTIMMTKNWVSVGVIWCALALPSLSDAAAGVVNVPGNNIPIVINSSPVHVQTKAAAYTADAGAYSGSTYAVIDVLVTDPTTGEPISNLGTSNSGATSGGGYSVNSRITIPGWTISTPLSPFSQYSPTQWLYPYAFLNLGGGSYRIHVGDFAQTYNGLLSTQWIAGDYHYVVTVNTLEIKGSGLGVLSIK